MFTGVKSRLGLIFTCGGVVSQWYLGTRNEGLCGHRIFKLLHFNFLGMAVECILGVREGRDDKGVENKFKDASHISVIIPI